MDEGDNIPAVDWTASSLGGGATVPISASGEQICAWGGRGSVSASRRNLPVGGHTCVFVCCAIPFRLSEAAGQYI